MADLLRTPRYVMGGTIDMLEALSARLAADAKAHEKEISVWSENYAALERKLAEVEAERNKLNMRASNAMRMLVAAEAEIAKLRKALGVAEQDFYSAANMWQDEDYEGPHERFSVPVVCHIKPYFDRNMQHLRDSASRARAALQVKP